MREATALSHTYTPVGRLWDPKTQRGNYDTDRKSIDTIIIHTMAGTTKGSTAHFQTPTTQSSAHYGVSLDGSLVQWILENAVSYHSGDYPTNQRSIGIEHEDGYNPTTRPNAFNEPRPDALYETSARLVADIAAFYKIPLDRNHVKKHNEVSQKKTACPGTLDIDRIIERAKQISNPQPSEEALIPHMLKPSVFKSLVTKATNADEIELISGLPKGTLAQPGVAKAVYEKIYNQAAEAIRAQETTSKTASPETVAGNDPSKVLQNPSVPENLTRQSKNIFKKDVLEILRDISATLKGRVTI